MGLFAGADGFLVRGQEKGNGAGSGGWSVLQVVEFGWGFLPGVADFWRAGRKTETERLAGVQAQRWTCLLAEGWARMESGGGGGLKAFGVQNVFWALPISKESICL